jgi:putative redox protein
MNVTLSTADGNLNKFIGTNEAGIDVTIGHQGEGVSPMENVLVSLAGCSTIDIIMILQKMRQEVVKVTVDVKSKRRDDIPRTFTDIHLHFIIFGNVKTNKAEQAVASSMEKYCSVSKMLEKAATITSSFEVTL